MLFLIVSCCGVWWRYTICKTLFYDDDFIFFWFLPGQKKIILSVEDLVGTAENMMESNLVSIVGRIDDFLKEKKKKKHEQISLVCPRTT